MAVWFLISAERWQSMQHFWIEDTFWNVIGFEPDDALGKFVLGVLKSAHIAIAHNEQKCSSSEEEKCVRQWGIIWTKSPNMEKLTAQPCRQSGCQMTNLWWWKIVKYTVKKTG